MPNKSAVILLWGGSANAVATNHRVASIYGASLRYYSRYCFIIVERCVLEEFQNNNNTIGRGLGVHEDTRQTYISIVSD